MPRIGLLSDTHGFLDQRIFEYFKECNEIWHAGDFGTAEISDQLATFKPLRGVYGNIDGTALRKIHPVHQSFVCEGVKVLMIHIGGSPGRYAPEAKKLLEEHRPKLFICGHSHILKVMRDKKMNNMLYLNPGAAGKEGFHKVRTLVRFEIKDSTIKNLDVIELEKRI